MSHPWSAWPSWGNLGRAGLSARVAGAYVAPPGHNSIDVGERMVPGNKPWRRLALTVGEAVQCDTHRFNAAGHADMESSIRRPPWNETVLMTQR